MTDTIRFLQHHRPGLTAGEYEISIKEKVEQKVGQNFVELKTFSKTRKFSVRGDRFTLKPIEVNAVFPSPGSPGDHSNVLPHIALNRSTLPWERHADSDNTDTPWLALLVFHEEEAPTPGIVSIEKLSSGVAKFPAIIPEGENKGDTVTFIDVKWKILKAVLPHKDELAILTHVSETTDYTITDQALAALKADGISDRVLTKLASIKEQEFVGEQAFLDALQDTIGDPHTVTTHQETIKRHAGNSVESAIIIGNRLPKRKGITTVHLVSVERRYNTKGNDFDCQNAGPDELIRLVSLYSWTFACIDAQQKFTGLLKRIRCTPSVLRLPDSKSDTANPYLALGAVPLWHTLREGGKTVSWYHGPLGTAEASLTNSSAPKLPIRAADALIRYNSTTGMFDISYAAAWEIGRLLALQSKTFSVSLYKWKRAHAQELRKIEESLLQGSPLDDDSVSVTVPPEIIGWFKHLSLLEGVPFNYLVPDERLLPLESLRFFQLDWLWIECLLDGAFSIGRVTAADHKLDGEHKKSPATNPHTKVSGIIMRSEVVAGWPGLLVDGLKGEEKLKLLRMDRLSTNVLLCLFDGQVTALDFHLRPEMAHFELNQKEEGSDRFYKVLRPKNGDKIEKQVDPLPWRQAPPGSPPALDISALATSIASTVKGYTSPLNSAQFAVQMIATSPTVRFSLSASLA